MSAFDRENKDIVADRLARVHEILARHPDLAFEDVWHAVICLEMTPLERLELALTRGRACTVSR